MLKQDILVIWHSYLAGFSLQIHVGKNYRVQNLEEQMLQ